MNKLVSLLLTLSLAPCIYSMESLKEYKVTFSDKRCLLLSKEILSHIPTINDCLNDTGADTIELDLDSSSWHQIDRLLPTYTMFCRLDKSLNINITPNEVQSKVKKNQIIKYTHMPTNISTFYPKNGRYPDAEEVVIKSLSNIIQKKHKELAAIKTMELYRQTDALNIDELIQLFHTADYLAIELLTQITLVTMMKKLEDIDTVETFFTKHQINKNAQDYIASAITNLEDNRNINKSYFNERHNYKKDPFHRYIDYITTNNQNLILAIGTKQRPIYCGLQVGISHYKKPKMPLIRNNESYNYDELLWLKSMQRVWQIQNIKNEWKEKTWEEIKGPHPHSVYKLKNPSYRIGICSRHYPTLYSIYSSIKDKSAAAQQMIDPQSCGDCYALNIPLFIPTWSVETINKIKPTGCLIEKKTLKAKIRRTTVKGTGLAIGVLGSSKLMYELYKQRIINFYELTIGSTLVATYALVRGCLLFYDFL